MAEEEEEGGGAGWIVSFADLMTLLFAAFVVLYGLKPEGETKEVLGVTSSIRESFVSIPDEIPEIEAIGPVAQGLSVLSHFKGDSVAEPFIKVFKRADYVENLIDKDMAEMKRYLIKLQGRKITKLKMSAKSSDFTVKRTNDGFLVRVLTTYLYKPGEFRIQRHQMDKVLNIGRRLADMDRDVFIEGHTDSSQSQGKFSNWEISALRATYLARLWTNEVNFPKTKLSAGGFADQKPVASNDNPSGRALNRRVDIKIRYNPNEL